MDAHDSQTGPARGEQAMLEIVDEVLAGGGPPHPPGTLGDLGALLAAVAPQPGAAFARRLEDQLVAALAAPAPGLGAATARSRWWPSGAPWRPNARVAAALLVALLVCAAATWPSLAGPLVLKYWAPREVPSLPTGGRTYAPTPGAPRRTPLTEMETDLGFRLLQPTYLPAGCSLHEHWIEPAMVANLTYYWSETFSGGKAVGADAPRPARGACVAIAERADRRVQMPRVGPNSVEEVRVAGEPALYVRGAWTRYGRDGQPFWDPSAGPALFFERGDRMIMVNGAPGTSRDEMIKIAESMR